MLKNEIEAELRRQEDDKVPAFESHLEPRDLRFPYIDYILKIIKKLRQCKEGLFGFITVSNSRHCIENLMMGSYFAVSPIKKLEKPLKKLVMASVEHINQDQSSGIDCEGWVIIDSK